MDREAMFDGFQPEELEAEAKARWGDTAAFAESKRRTSAYTKEDWARMRDDESAIVRELAALMDANVPPTDARAKAAAERHRLHIERWFYRCPHAMHVGLGELYVADPRFGAHYAKVREGLAEYLCEAIRANAAPT